MSDASRKNRVTMSFASRVGHIVANTLDPDNRALLQVKVEDADVTDEIFTRLMGDVVEPRREFIQENALNVANLDV
jgi:DNA gyrase/topoisomerase IV subunit B